MPRKGDDDTRGAKAKAQKAAAAAEKSSAAAKKKEADEAAAWMDGANTRALKKAEEAAREAAEKEARKREKEELLRKEAEELENMRRLRGADKVAARKTAKASEEEDTRARLADPGLSASGIAGAIAVMSIATGGGEDADLDTLTALATGVSAPSVKVDERHPEKRMKAAWKRFEERELPLLQVEFPSLRRSQLVEMLQRKWKKSPENPMNNPTLKDYDA